MNKRPLTLSIAISAIVAVAALLLRPHVQGWYDHKHQRRTVSDMFALTLAIDSYRFDYSRYPRTDSIDVLSRILHPDYMYTPPTEDAWKRPYRYEARPGPSYVLRSAGKDGHWQHEDPTSYHDSVTRDPDDDIVVLDGVFLASPIPLSRRPWPAHDHVAVLRAILALPACVRHARWIELPINDSMPTLYAVVTSPPDETWDELLPSAPASLGTLFLPWAAEDILPHHMRPIAQTPVTVGPGRVHWVRGGLLVQGLVLDASTLDRDPYHASMAVYLGDNLLVVMKTG